MGVETVGVEAEGRARVGVAWEGSVHGGIAGRREGTLGLRRSAGRRVARRGVEARGPAACMRRDALFRRSLLLADTVAIVGALVLTVALSSRRVPLALTWESLIGVPALLIAAKLLGLYDRDETLLRKTTLDEAPKLLQLATLCTLVAWLAGPLVVAGTLERKGALLLWLALTALLILARVAARTFALRMSPVERCLLIGDERSAEMIRSKLTGGHCGIKADVVAQLDLDKADLWSADSFSPERLAEIGDLARMLDVHRAIVAPGWGVDGEGGEGNAGGTLNLVRTLKAVGVRVSVLPRLLEVVGSSVEFDDLHGVTVMGVRRFELTRSSAAFKRAFDLLGACVLLVAVAPLMLAFAIAIKLDSRGPVLFRQQRVGRHGKRFQMLKFRTMVADAEQRKDSLRYRNEAHEGLFKIAGDPRVTRIGRLLRRSSLDELPQLLNILTGEMSLVGPRPLVLDEDRRIEGWHRRRLELTPGMTGPWQILGPTRVPLKEMVAIDYLYIANWSLWSDIKILMRTVSHVVRLRGM